MSFETMYCKGNIRQIGFYDLNVTGRIIDDVKDNTIHYMAGSGADRRATFNGSGLPFANQLQAFDNTPNVGDVKLDSMNHFSINIVTPNSYMVGLGSVKIPPTLYIEYTKPCGTKRNVAIKVAEPIAYRSLTYPLDPKARIDASFYDSQFKLIPKTQEQIFIDGSYPCNGIEDKTFWGLRPPL